MPTELLKLIETVSPDDTATLDEIDAPLSGLYILTTTSSANCVSSGYIAIT